MKKKVLIFILIALIFNGFKDAREVNYMAIVSSIGIDVTDEDEYIITAEVFNTKKNDSSSSNSNPEIITYESKANSVHKALRDMVKKSPNKLYLGHLDLVMLSENEMVRYNSVKSENLFPQGGGIPYGKWVIPNSCIGKPVLLPFEDDEFLAPQEYDKYLTLSYGNYMQLPPIEKRGNWHKIIEVKL